jgi:hypothetical protein
MNLNRIKGMLQEKMSISNNDQDTILDILNIIARKQRGMKDDIKEIIERNHEK